MAKAALPAPAASTCSSAKFSSDMRSEATVHTLLARASPCSSVSPVTLGPQETLGPIVQVCPCVPTLSLCLPHAPTPPHTHTHTHTHTRAILLTPSPPAGNSPLPALHYPEVTLCPGLWVLRAMLLSRVRLFVTPWTVACQAPQSMRFLRQEHWSRVPRPCPGALPTQGLNLRLLCLLRW